jgi:hypothetical protein
MRTGCPAVRRVGVCPEASRLVTEALDAGFATGGTAEGIREPETRSARADWTAEIRDILALAILETTAAPRRRARVRLAQCESIRTVAASGRMPGIGVRTMRAHAASLSF